MTQVPQDSDPRIAWPPANTPASARVFAKNVIEIAATPADVWSLLVDCTRWPSWYKRCEDVSLLSGDGVLGPDSSFRFKTLGAYFEPEITAFEPAACWSGERTGRSGPAARMPGTSSPRETTAAA